MFLHFKVKTHLLCQALCQTPNQGNLNLTLPASWVQRFILSCGMRSQQTFSTKDQIVRATQSVSVVYSFVLYNHLKLLKALSYLQGPQSHSFPLPVDVNMYKYILMVSVFKLHCTFMWFRRLLRLILALYKFSGSAFTFKSLPTSWNFHASEIFDWKDTTVSSVQSEFGGSVLSHL